MSLEDYENTETQFKENSVLKVKKFKLKEILPASEKSVLKLKHVDVLGQPGKEVMSQVSWTPKLKN